MTDDAKLSHIIKRESKSAIKPRHKVDDACHGCNASNCIACPHWIVKVNSAATHQFVEHLRGHA